MNDLDHTPPQTKFNILLIGDSCIDEYKIGTVDRLSPEAPVPIIKHIDTITVPGMAANVRQNLINLGLESDFVTNNVEIRKTRYIDQRSRQHILRVDTEPYVPPWNGHTPKLLNEYDAIVISDYNKGFLTYEHIEQIINSTTCPIFIDTKKDNLTTFGRKDVYIKINELEFKKLISYTGNLIVTLGDKGARLGPKEFPTQPVEVVDVCGCGDTFLAALTTQYLFTKDIEKAIIFANVAAGLTVQHQGNYAPTLEEINAGY